MSPEANPSLDQDATLELGGAAPVPVHVAVRSVDGVEMGVLRLAYGQGSFVNRILNSVGQEARLTDARGRAHRIVITSTEPKDAPGYLCSFRLTRPQTTGRARKPPAR